MSIIKCFNTKRLLMMQQRSLGWRAAYEEGRGLVGMIEHASGHGNYLMLLSLLLYNAGQRSVSSHVSLALALSLSIINLGT